jgi:hypothetical protein
MSVSDTIRICELEAALSSLHSRVEALEARQAPEAPACTAGGRDRDHASQRPSSAPIGDTGGAVFIEKLAPHGTNRHTARGGVATSAGDRGATYVLRRLKRDYPEIAEQVVAGKLSANAAAIAAGFRRRRITVPADHDAATD